MPKRGKGFNEKSLKNLKQNQDARLKKLKERAAKELSEEVDLDEEQLEIIIPTKALFKEKEQERFISFLKMYLRQFGRDANLEVSDLVAIATLCKNHILEDRIILEAASTADAMLPVEKLKKENSKLIEQLAATRVQRVDPRAGQDFTIMDVIDIYEREEKASIKQRLESDLKEEEAFKDKISTTVSGLL